MATVFAPGAVWESPLLELRFESARSLIDFQTEGSARLDVLVQTPHSPVISLLDAERANATTTIHEFFRGTASDVSAYGDTGSEINVDQYGIYYDQLAKTDGGWKFTHRLFVPFLIASDRVVGDVVSARPMLRSTSG